MKKYFADLHIHVGMSEKGKWIKIPTSKTLTVRNILEEASHRKGMDMVGIVDAMSPLVLDDLEQMIRNGELTLLPGGGYRFKNRVTIILGAEIETAEMGGGLAHCLIFLPDIETMRHFSGHMSKYIRNIHMSSQNAHMSLNNLIMNAAAYNPLIVPAHIFTPYKSLYGSCTNRMGRILSEQAIAAISAVELGLSADTGMADQMKDLSKLTFVTNSDAHSLDKIAREYNIIRLAEPTFLELCLALTRKKGRGVAENYGLDPRLGKYHRTCCSKCGNLLPNAAGDKCSSCGCSKLIRGVLDRVNEIADWPEPRHPAHRSRYFYQIPLAFIPGIGKKTLAKLLEVFGTEMNVVHRSAPEELVPIVGEKVTAQIMGARTGRTEIIEGGGGIYGRLAKS